MERAINKNNILKVLLCEEWFFDELQPAGAFYIQGLGDSRLRAGFRKLLLFSSDGQPYASYRFDFRFCDHDHFSHTVLFALAGRYGKPRRKTDEGFTWFYINLSYRRRFRRTIYMIVFLTAVMTFLFVKNEGEYGFYISLGLIVVAYIFAMAQSVGGLLYNRRKWKAAETS